MSDSIRVTLTETDFKALIDGKVITLPRGVEIALEDIGYFFMLKMVQESWDALKRKMGGK